MCAWRMRIKTKGGTLCKGERGEKRRKRREGGGSEERRRKTIDGENS
jgi:hypothetical protein